MQVMLGPWVTYGDHGLPELPSLRAIWVAVTGRGLAAGAGVLFYFLRGLQGCAVLRGGHGKPSVPAEAKGIDLVAEPERKSADHTHTEKGTGAVRKYLIPVFLFITLALFIWGGIRRPTKSLVYVPVDERPLNLAYVEEVAQVAGIELHTPPRNLLPDYKVPADVEALWSWTLAQKGRAAVLSADALIYGGLISSRSHQIPLDELMKRAEKFRQYREAHPEQKLYVFVTLMRTPNSDSAVSEPDYYARYGKMIFRLSSLEDKKSTVGLKPAEEEELAELKNLIPADVYSDWEGRREKNLAVTRKLMEMVCEGVIDLLILCRDDTAKFSRSRQEYRELIVLQRQIET